MSRVIVIKDVSAVSYISEVADDFPDPKPNEFVILKGAYQLLSDLVPVAQDDKGRVTEVRMLIKLLPIDPSVTGPSEVVLMPSSFFWPSLKSSLPEALQERRIKDAGIVSSSSGFKTL